jgi:hypothetical protein
VWAVGGWERPGEQSRPLVEHWDGSSWSLSPQPDMANGELHGVVALAADDVWAVGIQQDPASPWSSALVEHWDGTSWTVVPVPPGEGFDAWLTAVTAVSPTEVWAVGSFRQGYSPSRTLTERWDGGSWQVVEGPNISHRGNGNEPSAVAATRDGVVFLAGTWEQNQGIEYAHPLVMRRCGAGAGTDGAG